MSHVVIDNGAGSVKFGLLGHAVPALEVPNFKAEPRNQAGGKRLAAIGERKIDELRSGYLPNRPVQAGLLLDASTQLEIWSHGLNAVLPKHTSLADVSITFTETPATPPATYASLLELLFETLGVASVAAVPTAVCTMLAFPPNSALLANPGSTCIRASPYPADAAQRLEYEYELFGNRELIPDNEGRTLVDVGFTGTLSVPTYRNNLVESGCYRNYSGLNNVNLALQRMISFKNVNLTGFYHIVDQLRRDACYIESRSNLRRRIDELSSISRKLSQNPRVYEQVYDLSPEGTRFGDVGRSVPYVYDTRSESIFQPPDLLRIMDEKQLASIWQDKIILGPERVTACESLLTSVAGEYYVSRDVGDRGVCIPVRLWGGGYPRIGPTETSVRVYPAAGAVGLATMSIFSAPPILQSSVANVICLTGAGADIPGFVNRFAEDIRADLPSSWSTTCVRLKPARLATWVGACVWAASPRYYTAVLTKEKYKELGSSRIKRSKVTSS